MFLRFKYLVSGSVAVGVYLEDVARVCCSYLLNVNSSIGAADHNWSTTVTVHQDGKVGLFSNIQGLRNHNLAESKRARQHVC